MDSDTKNVVPTQRRDSVDAQISDLVRAADLAMHAWLSGRELVGPRYYFNCPRTVQPHDEMP
jgi:hypothetical protein